MSTKFRKRNVYVSNMYTFESGPMVISSSKYLGSLRPYYQQKKLANTSLSVGIHKIEDESSSAEIAFEKVNSAFRTTGNEFLVFSPRRNPQEINRRIHQPMKEI